MQRRRKKPPRRFPEDSNFSNILPDYSRTMNSGVREVQARNRRRRGNRVTRDWRLGHRLGETTAGLGTAAAGHRTRPSTPHPDTGSATLASQTGGTAAPSPRQTGTARSRPAQQGQGRGGRPPSRTSPRGQGPEIAPGLSQADAERLLNASANLRFGDEERQVGRNLRDTKLHDRVIDQAHEAYARIADSSIAWQAKRAAEQQAQIGAAAKEAVSGLAAGGQAAQAQLQKGLQTYGGPEDGAQMAQALADTGGQAGASQAGAAIMQQSLPALMQQKAIDSQLRSGRQAAELSRTQAFEANQRRRNDLHDDLAKIAGMRGDYKVAEQARLAQEAWKNKISADTLAQKKTADYRDYLATIYGINTRAGTSAADRAQRARDNAAGRQQRDRANRRTTSTSRGNNTRNNRRSSALNIWGV